MHNFIARSVKKPIKTKCGDASFAGEVEIDNKPYILLMVADGVSRAPKDWLASRSTVDLIISELRKGKLPIPKVLKAAVEHANQVLFSGIEDTHGMLTTLSLVLLSSEDQHLWAVNIGDSRLYGVEEGLFECLTTDDSRELSSQEQGGPILHQGSSYKRSVLTKAIGQPGLDINVTEHITRGYEAFVLASDGFYGLHGFERNCKRLITESDMAKTALEIETTIINEITDDASFALLRMITNNKADLRTLLAQEEQDNISPTWVLTVLETEIKNSVLNQDFQYVDQILDFITRKQISYNKKKMIELLDFMIVHHNPSIQKMISLIKKL